MSKGAGKATCSKRKQFITFDEILLSIDIELDLGRMDLNVLKLCYLLNHSSTLGITAICKKQTQSSLEYSEIQWNHDIFLSIFCLRQRLVYLQKRKNEISFQNVENLKAPYTVKDQFLSGSNCLLWNGGQMIYPLQFISLPWRIYQQEYSCYIFPSLMAASKKI